MSTNIQALTAQLETELNASPFLPQNPAEWRGTSGDIVYGVNLPGKDARSGKYQRWEADGSSRVWTENQIVNLANAVTAALTDANALTVVAKANGTVLKRVATTAAPGTNQFKVTAGSPGIATVTFSGVPADAGTVTIDDGTNTPTVFEFDTGDDGVATTSNVEVDTSASTTALEAAAAFVAAVNGVTSTLTVTAHDNSDGTVTLISDTAGEIGDLGVTESATNLTVVDFAGDADSTVSIHFGDLHAVGTKLEIFLTAAADVDSITIPAGGVIEAATPQVVRSDSAAAVTVVRLTR